MRRISVTIHLDESERFYVQQQYDRPTEDTFRVRVLTFTLGVPEGTVTAYAARIVRSTRREETNAKPLSLSVDSLPAWLQDEVRSIVTVNQAGL